MSKWYKLDWEESVGFVGIDHPTRATVQELLDAQTESIFEKMMQRSTGGVRVLTNSAPAASTSFVKASHAAKASIHNPGYFAEVTYPKETDLHARHEKLHTKEEDYGYHQSYGSRAYHVGFGEKSARALSREESIYQLRGAFPAAMMNFTKLRARIEARIGHVADVDAIFALEWGLYLDSVNAIPRLVVEGSEATRLSALEDRSYHALSGHPSHTGGFRVDTATIAADALGSDIPLNWARLRTTVKAIAEHQISADITMSNSIHSMQKLTPTKWGLNIVTGSQPRYERGQAWEGILLAILTGDPAWKDLLLSHPDAEGMALSCQLSKLSLAEKLEEIEGEVVPQLRRLAVTVAEDSAKSLQKSIEVMIDFDQDRQHASEQDRIMYEALDRSLISRTYEIPRYKLTRESMLMGIKRPHLDRNPLPDMVSHTRARPTLDFREFREANVTLNMDIRGALHLAVFLVVNRREMAMYAYVLMHQLHNEPGSGKVGINLRNEELFDNTLVRETGKFLFNEAFMFTLEHIIHNSDMKVELSDISIKRMIWDCLSKRCRRPRRDPPVGGWKDLIRDLWTSREGWSLYYWARISIGKIHRSLVDGILAPVTAGSAVDFLSIIRLGISKRSHQWRDFYSARVKCIEGTLDKKGTRKKKTRAVDDLEVPAKAEEAPRYVAPALRSRTDLDAVFDAEVLTNRRRKYKPETYEKLVIAQSKSKFFGSLKVHTFNSRIVVGITDEDMRQMLVDFYQARWFSIEKRIEKALATGDKFTLAGKEITEHPWGEFVEELPGSCSGVLEFVCSLDGIGWTVDPRALYDMFRKSISEMWADISQEIGSIVQYINDIEDGKAQEQEIAMEARPDLDTMRATLGLPPINIPAFGYVPPYQLPNQRQSIMNKSGSGRVNIPTDPDVHIYVPPHRRPESSGPDVVEIEPELPEFINRPNPLPELEPEPVANYTSLEGFDDDDAMDLDDLMTFNHDIDDDNAQLPEVHDTHLTYRELWREIGMAETTDERMRFAFTLPGHISLDDQHVDSTHGPVICDEDRATAKRKWRAKKDMMEYRLGVRAAEITGDDMRLGPDEYDD